MKILGNIFPFPLARIARTKLFSIGVLVCLLLEQTLMASTLSTVQERGFLLCGIDGAIPGFSQLDDTGKVNGLDADICYALAAAIFGDKSLVRFIPLTARERFTSLKSGDIDVLSRNTTFSFTRDASLGLNFAYHIFIDGQAFMLSKELGIKKIEELSEARICVRTGTTTESNLADYFRSNNLQFTPVGFDTVTQTRRGFANGACDAVTADKSNLVSMLRELKNPESYVILDKLISKEPLAPVVRQGDDNWFDVVNWTIYVLINAEERDITSKNVQNKRDTSTNPTIRRMLGSEGNFGTYLNLKKDWAYQIIRQIGNYAEVYQRNIAPLGISRLNTPNALWTDGGIMYAPPFR